MRYTIVPYGGTKTIEIEIPLTTLQVVQQHIGRPFKPGKEMEFLRWYIEEFIDFVGARKSLEEAQQYFLNGIKARYTAEELADFFD